MSHVTEITISCMCTREGGKAKLQHAGFTHQTENLEDVICVTHCLTSAQKQYDVEAQSDTGSTTVEALLWDPHAGMKPSPLDEWESDASDEIEDTLPYGASQAIQSLMVDMMVELDDEDAQDIDWLPPRERRKLEARKKDKGKRKIHSHGPNIAAKEHAHIEESEQTHQFLIHRVSISIVFNLIIGFTVTSTIKGGIEGCDKAGVEGAVHRVHEPSPSPISDFANLRDPSRGHSPNLQGLSPVKIKVLGQSEQNPPHGCSRNLQGSSPVKVEVLEQSSRGPSCGHSHDLQGSSPVEVEVPEQSSQDLTGQSENGLEDDMPSSEGEEDKIDSLLDTGSSKLEVHENVHDWREL
ncbi:hypothetical protein BC827DRAFT_1152825 [Russula dissimulans]|nr:hypothetical protein BC827DRAFT_1152825 [Russula dissimulans]